MLLFFFQTDVGSVLLSWDDGMTSSMVLGKGFLCEEWPGHG